MRPLEILEKEQAAPPAVKPAIPERFIGLGDQELIDDSEWRKGCEIIDWIQSVINDRPGYLNRHRLDAEIHFPQAIWGNLNGPLFDGFRALCSKDRRVLNYFRMWTQHFTGYRLFSMELAIEKSFPDPAEVSPAADGRYLRIANRPDFYVARYLDVCSKLPPEMHISPPVRFGEIGWVIDGKIVTCDTYAYQERIALMFECGAIDQLKVVAAAGRTPRILEIGGGFGGLAYHLKKIVPQAHVVIVDIPESLVFAAAYLSLSIPHDRFVYMTGASPTTDLMCDEPGCTFVPNFMFDRVVDAGFPFDLAINTLSMSEMGPDQVSYYCRGIQKLLAPQGGFFEQNQDNSTIGKVDARRVIVTHFAHGTEFRSRIVPNPVHGNAHIWSRHPWRRAAARLPGRLAKVA